MALPEEPKLPRGEGLSKEEKEKTFDAYLEASSKYQDDLKSWEQAQPKNKPILFKSSTGVYNLITKDPEGGWRSTAFTRLWNDEPDYAPLGHERYTTRYEAVKEHIGELVDKLPPILTEAEINEKRLQKNAAAATKEAPLTPAAEVVPSEQPAAPSTITARSSRRSARAKSEEETRIPTARAGASPARRSPHRSHCY